jgi:mannose-6-phosphate isomerase-like protein (cupin superfamily)
MTAYACSDEQRDLWFLNTRVLFRVSHQDGPDAISVLEHWAAFGDSPPLHVHHKEDEVFQVLAGDVRFHVDGREQRATVGDILLVPQGTSHTYWVESAEGARFLTITCGREFERFVRAYGRPAERHGLPDPSGPLTPEQAEALAQACRQYGIELVGPPLS